MAWPQIDEFRNAILHKGNLKDPELARGRLAMNKLGLPMSWAGGMAVAYRITVGNKSWAVRTFKGDTNYIDSYAKIANAIEKLPAESGSARQYFAEFKYLPKGLTVASRKQTVAPYPIVKMEWVEGKRLDSWVEAHLHDKKALLDMAHKWRVMVRTLHNQGIAHGDLQQGNVLVTASGALVLIDYDGMYVPTMKGERARELGHPNWNHPQRAPSHFGPYLDQFTGLVGFISLLALAQDKTLFRTHNNGENLIIRSEDLKNLRHAPIFKSLKKLKQPANGAESLANVAEKLAAWCESAVDCMTLEEAVGGKSVARAVTRAGAAAVAPRVAPSRVTLIVQTNMPGAVIKIGDTVYGQTDDQTGKLEALVEPRIITIQASHPGHVPLAKKVDLRRVRGTCRCTLTLTPIAGPRHLVVRSQPQGAEVLVDGDPYGLTHIGGLQIPLTGLPGRIKIQVSKVGYKTVTKVVNIDKSADLELGFSLERIHEPSLSHRWLFSGALGLAIAILALKAFGNGYDFTRYWGMAATVGALISMVCYQVVESSHQRLSGGALLVGTTVLSLALAAPEILLSMPNPDPMVYDQQTLIKMLVFRYAAFLVGFLAAWPPANRLLKTKVNPDVGAILFCLLAVAPPIIVVYFLPKGLGIPGSSIFALATTGGVSGLLMGICAGAIVGMLPNAETAGRAVSARAALAIVVVLLIFAWPSWRFFHISTTPAFLIVKSHPSEVETWDADKYLGKTSEGLLKVDFPGPRDLFLKFSKDGWESEYRRVSVTGKALGDTVEIELNRAYADIVFRCNASNPQVSVNGVAATIHHDSGDRFRITRQPVGTDLLVEIQAPHHKAISRSVPRLPTDRDHYDLGQIQLDSRTAQLHVTSSPTAAKIYVNDDYYGTTDSVGRLDVTDLPVGKRLQFRAEKPGWEQIVFKQRTFNMDDLVSNVNVELKRKLVRLLVKTNVEGATVMIDDVKKCVTGVDGSCTISDVPVEHEFNINVSKAGYQSASSARSIRDDGVASGALFQEKIQLVRSPMKVILYSRPANVEIWANGHLVGNTGESGRVTMDFEDRATIPLVARKTGYKELQTTKTVSKGARYDFLMEKNMVPYRVTTDPGGVDVIVDAVRVGETNPEGNIEFKLQSGVQHDIRLSKKGYHDQSQSIVVPDSLAADGMTFSMKRKPVSVVFNTDCEGECIVRARRRDTSASSYTDTDSTGRATLNLEPGDYTVEISKRGYPTKPITVSVTHDMTPVTVGFNDKESKRAKRLYEEGKKLFSRHKYSAAVEKFTGALRLKPVYQEAVFNRGLSYLAEKDYKSASKDLEEIIKDSPGDDEALFWLGQISYRQKRYAEALEKFERALKVKATCRSALAAASAAFGAGKSEKGVVYEQMAKRLGCRD